jgi:hypothetical protein
MAKRAVHIVVPQKQRNRDARRGQSRIQPHPPELASQ